VLVPMAEPDHFTPPAPRTRGPPLSVNPAFLKLIELNGRPGKVLMLLRTVAVLEKTRSSPACGATKPDQLNWSLQLLLKKLPPTQVLVAMRLRSSKASRRG